MAGCGCGGTVLGTSRPPSLDPPQSPRTRGETCAKAHGFASCCVLLLWRVKESISLVLEGLGVWGKGNHSCECSYMSHDAQIRALMQIYTHQYPRGLSGVYSNRHVHKKMPRRMDGYIKVFFGPARLLYNPGSPDPYVNALIPTSMYQYIPWVI